MAKKTENIEYGRKSNIEIGKGFRQKAFYFPNRLTPVMKEYSKLAREKMKRDKYYLKVRADSIVMRRLLLTWTLNNTNNEVIKEIINEFFKEEDITLKRG